MDIHCTVVEQVRGRGRRRQKRRPIRSSPAKREHMANSILAESFTWGDRSRALSFESFDIDRESGWRITVRSLDAELRSIWRT